MKSYQSIQGHRAVQTRDSDRRDTFDEKAIVELKKRYPTDRLYPLISRYRNAEKLKGTYVGSWDDTAQRWVGGIPTGQDGRAHPSFFHNPSTLRLSGDMQQIPRGNDDLLQARVKQLIVAEPEHVLLEADYSAIEGVLVGYFANSADFVRLAKLGLHDHATARLKGIDIDLKGSDEDLRLAFAEIKERFPVERDATKRGGYLSLYGGTPARLCDAYPEYWPTRREAAKFQDFFFETYPEIKRWQNQTVALAGRQAYLRNPFGYLHRFWNVLSWRKVDGKWEQEWAEDAKRALAFLPQSTAAAIIKEAMLRLRDRGLAPLLRLQVHDSLVCMLPSVGWENLAATIVEVMTAPNPELPLDPTWQMGEALTIGVESKVGESWGSLRKVA
jgi:DNA polymerase-1